MRYVNTRCAAAYEMKKAATLSRALRMLLSLLRSDIGWLAKKALRLSPLSADAIREVVTIAACCLMSRRYDDWR